MIARASLHLAALALAAGLSLLTGCSEMETKEAQMDIDHRMLVLPLKDRLQFHFDSQRGIGIARMVTEKIQAAEAAGGDGIGIVPFEDLEAEIAKLHSDPKELKPEDLGRMMKADCVLVGSIDSYEKRIPGDIAFKRGRATVTFKVIDVAKPQRSLLTKKIDVKYPDEKGNIGGGIAPQDTSDDEIDAGLTEILARKIAECFYDHEERKEHGGLPE